MIIFVQGKFVRIHFGTNGKIAGADIETCEYDRVFTRSRKRPALARVF